jgi:hypothetical protein
MMLVNRANVAPVDLWRSPDRLRAALLEMRDDLLDRMIRRGGVEPAY